MAQAKPTDPVEKRDRPFNPLRMPVTDAGRAFVADVLERVQAFETVTTTRTRKRKHKDYLAFVQRVTALACDAVHLELSGTGGGLAVSLSNQKLGNKSRYRPSWIGESLPQDVRNMADRKLSLLALEVGYRNPLDQAASKQTTLKPGRKLRSLIATHKVTLGDFKCGHDGEVIRLKSAKGDHWTKGQLMEYADTEDTMRYRAEMQEINEWLAQADIEYVQHGSKMRRPDTTKRNLFRAFNNGQFNEGGRLFGGFWQSMGKVARLRCLEIEGDSVTELDYAAMSARLAYGMVGVTPLLSDPYSLPGLEYWREGVKLFFNALLAGDSPIRRMPQGMRGKLPGWISAQELAERICAAHRPIAHLFQCGKHSHLMFLESRIIVALLLRLKAEGIVALQIHDAIIVPDMDGPTAQQIMLEVFRHHTGIDGVVTETRSIQETLG